MRALTHQEYWALYPHERSSLSALGFGNPYHKGCVIVKSGFLLFTESSAHNWAAPFSGNYAVFVLQDFTNAECIAHGKSVNLLDMYDESRKAAEAKVARGHNEYKSRYEKVFSTDYNDRPSKALPIQLKMYGNDDTSYAKFYPNVDSALSELELFEENQPLDFEEIVKGFGFIFTN